MGYPLTTPSDYTGIVSISRNKYTDTDLEAYIEANEEDILEDLLGCDMTTELIADLDGSNNPVDQKFIDIWDKFCIDDNNYFSFISSYSYFYDYHPYFYGMGSNIQWKSKGILDLLKYQIYFLFTRDQKVKNTITGNVENENVVSKLVANYNTNMIRNYNTSLDWYYAIQWKICKNEDSLNYDNFNGIIKQPIGLI